MHTSSVAFAFVGTIFHERMFWKLPAPSALYQQHATAATLPIFTMENVSRSHTKMRMFISDGFSFDPTKNIFFFFERFFAAFAATTPTSFSSCFSRWISKLMWTCALSMETFQYACEFIGDDDRLICRVHTARTVAAYVATLFIELDRRERIRSTLENWIMLISHEREETWKRKRNEHEIGSHIVAWKLFALSMVIDCVCRMASALDRFRIWMEHASCVPKWHNYPHNISYR